MWQSDPCRTQSVCRPGCHAHSLAECALSKDTQLDGCLMSVEGERYGTGNCKPYAVWLVPAGWNMRCLVPCTGAKTPDDPSDRAGVRSAQPDAVLT